jgi:hypothetical protein
MFENKVLKKMFGPEGDGVMGVRGKLHNEELHDLYSSSSRRMRWAGHVARMGEKRNACRLMVGKPKRLKPLGRLTRRCVDSSRRIS